MDFLTGDWKLINENDNFDIPLDIEAVYKNDLKMQKNFSENEKELYEKTMAEAHKIANELTENIKYKKCHPSLKKLMFFYYVNSKNDYAPKDE